MDDQEIINNTEEAPEIEAVPEIEPIPEPAPIPEPVPEPAPAPAPEPATSNGLAIASLIVGIASIVLSYAFVIPALIVGIVGIVLGSKARKECPCGMATAGFVCSIVGTVLSGLLLVCVACGIGLAATAVASDPELAAELSEVTGSAAGFFTIL